MRDWLILYVEGMPPFICERNESNTDIARAMTIAKDLKMVSLPGEDLAIVPSKFTASLKINCRLLDLPCPCILWYNETYYLIKDMSEFLEI